MKKLLYILLFVILNLFQHLHAQQNKIDSLLTLLKTDKEDTNKVMHLNALGWLLKQSNPDTAIILGNQALAIAQKQEWKKGIDRSLNQLGFYNYLKGNYPAALDYYFKALKIDDIILSEAKNLSEKQNTQKGIAGRLSNIGLVYHNQADYPKALAYYLKALKLAEELNHKQLQANTLGNIGNVYNVQADYPKALDYYLKALKLTEELGDKNGVAIWLANIGIVYKEQANYPKALDYQLRALNITEELGDKQLQANTIANIGSVYLAQANYPKALDYYLKALKPTEELGDKNGVANTLGNIGTLYTKTGKYTEAEKYLLDALKLGKEIGVQDVERQVEELLSSLYEKTKREGLALQHYKKAMQLKDTLYSAENKKQLIKKEMNFEFEKKEIAAKAEQDKLDAINSEEKKKQQIVIYAVAGLLILVGVFAVFMFNRFKITQKQKTVIEEQKQKVDTAYTELDIRNKEIEEQKKIVEEHHKDVMDSIRYAKRIQTALITSEKSIANSLKRLMKNG